MTDEQFRRLPLMLDAIRIAALARISTDGPEVTEDERKDSDMQAAAAMYGNAERAEVEPALVGRASAQ